MPKIQSTTDIIKKLKLKTLRNGWDMQNGRRLGNLTLKLVVRGRLCVEARTHAQELVLGKFDIEKKLCV